MQRKDLALRVLSTAAIMSIVTSIAAPAFADVYYIGNGSIDVETMTSTDGKQQYVKVTQGNKTYTDTSDEIVIKDGTDEDHTTLREDTRIKEKKSRGSNPGQGAPRHAGAWKQPGLRTLPGRASLTRTRPLP